MTRYSTRQIAHVILIYNREIPVVYVVKNTLNYSEHMNIHILQPRADKIIRSISKHQHTTPMDSKSILVSVLDFISDPQPLFLDPMKTPMQFNRSV